MRRGRCRRAELHRPGLFQLKFAALLGVSVRILQEWEQGRRVDGFGLDLARSLRVTVS